MRQKVPHPCENRSLHGGATALSRQQSCLPQERALRSLNARSGSRDCGEEEPPRGDLESLLQELEFYRLQLERLNETLEQQVVERTALADRRASQLQLLARRLTETEHRQRRRFAELLHDHLQQLLVAARLGTAMARRRAADEEVARSLTRVDRLIDESIEVSRSLALELCPPVLYDVGFVAALEWLVRHMAEKHQVAVELSADPEVEPANSEMRSILFEVVRELLLNVAMHAGVKQARVDARRTDAGMLEVIVSDEGTGFDPAALESAESGGGFGLFTMRERLKLVGGTLRLDAEPRKGTHATVIMPQRSLLFTDDEENDIEPDGALSPAPEMRELAVPDRKIRVVLADDHAIVREGLASLLMEEPDMVVVGQASDGQEAVELTVETRPDVVLMDVTMPRLDGIEATRQIKSRLPDVRVIGLSMHDKEDLAEAMREAGAAAYLSKNGCCETLIGTIRSQGG